MVFNSLGITKVISLFALDRDKEAHEWMKLYLVRIDQLELSCRLSYRIMLCSCLNDFAKYSEAELAASQTVEMAKESTTLDPAHGYELVAKTDLLVALAHQHKIGKAGSLVNPGFIIRWPKFSSGEIRGYLVKKVF